MDLMYSLLSDWSCGFKVCEPPYANRVDAATKRTPDLAYFGESIVLGHNVSNLVHGSPPSKTFIQMIEYLYCICCSFFPEESKDLASQASGF